jgi:biotin carboxyl carrier protein
VTDPVKVAVQSELQGTIVGVFVEAGSPVRLGQVLVTLDRQPVVEMAE